MNRPDEDRWFDLFRQRGDVTALAKVFDATSPELARVARHLCRNVEIAEDAVQGTFLTAIDARAQWDASRPLLPWLLGLLTNQVREQRRSALRQPEPDRVAAPFAGEDPLEVASRREVSAEVRAALEAVDQPFREALERRLFRLQSAEEIARELGIAAGTVRMRIHRGMDRLRQRLPASLAPGWSATAVAGLPVGAMERMRSSVLQAAEAASTPMVAAGSVPTVTWTAFLSFFAMHKPIVLTAAAIAVVALAIVPLVSLFGAGTSPAPQRSGDFAEPFAGTDAVPSRAVPVDDAPRRREVVGADIDADRPGTIHLTVRGDGAALYGVRIELVAESAMPHGRALATGRTDPAGIFTAEVPAGRLAIRVPALDEPHVGSLTVPSGAPVEADLDLQVQLIAKVTVLDASGRPLAGARITGYASAERTTIATDTLGVTQDDGSWQRAFVSRHVEIRAVADGHVQSGSHVVGNDPIEIRLQSGPGSIQGTVYGTDGAPAPGAEVAILTESEQRLESQPQGIRCDAQGRFRYDHLPPGPVTLVATRFEETSHGRVSQIARTAAEVVVGLPTITDLQFGRDAGAAQVEVRNAAGAPLRDVRVSLLRSDRDLPGFLGVHARGERPTDERGEARITGLLPGSYRLHCSPEGRPITRDVQIVAGETAAVVVAPELSSDLEFLVRDRGGEPLEGMLVSITPEAGGQGLDGITDSAGRAQLRGVGHGDHVLRVHRAAANRGDRGAAVLERRLAVTASVVEELRVDLANLSQVGGLVTTDGRVPLTGLEARLVSLTGLQGITIPIEAGEAAREAEFRFDDVPPGTWLVSIRRQDQDLAIVESVEVAGDGAPVDVGTLTLGVGSTTLELSRSDGESVRDAVLLVRLGNLDLRRLGLPPQSNRIRLVNMPAFVPADAYVWGPEVAPAQVALRVVAGESLRIPVTLQPGTKTTLVLPPVDPKPPIRQGIYEWTRDGAPFIRERVLDGDRLTRGLPPGSYTVTFEPMNEPRRAAASFTVGAEPVEVRLAWE